MESGSSPLRGLALLFAHESLHLGLPQLSGVTVQPNGYIKPRPEPNGGKGFAVFIDQLGANHSVTAGAAIHLELPLMAIS